MTPEQQVKEIILLMNPEDPGTADAVFLVQKYMEKMTGLVSARDKTIAMLEAKIQSEQQLRSNIENEKLASEAQLKKEKKEILDNMGIKPVIREDKPKPPGGNTK